MLVCLVNMSPLLRDGSRVTMPPIMFLIPVVEDCVLDCDDITEGTLWEHVHVSYRTKDQIRPLWARVGWVELFHLKPQQHLLHFSLVHHRDGSYFTRKVMYIVPEFNDEGLQWSRLLACTVRWKLHTLPVLVHLLSTHWQTWLMNCLVSLSWLSLAE